MSLSAKVATIIAITQAGVSLWATGWIGAVSPDWIPDSKRTPALLPACIDCEFTDRIVKEWSVYEPSYIICSWTFYPNRGVYAYCDRYQCLDKHYYAFLGPWYSGCDDDLISPPNPLCPSNTCDP